MAQKILLLLFTVVLLAGCSKSDEFLSGSDLPVFWVKCSIQDTSLTINAGQNGYYMYTEYYTDTLGVLVGVGRLAKTNCSGDTCPGVLQFSLRNLNNGSSLIGNDFANLDTYYYNSGIGVVNTADSMQFGGARICWTDSFGEIWCSDRVLQGQEAYFKITGVSSYDPNEKKQSTLRLEIAFQADLHNATGSVKTIKGTGVIGIANP